MTGNGPANASVFELVQPLAEPTTDQAVMRAYRVNPLRIFPARAYEEDRIIRPFFGRPSVMTSRTEDIRHVLIDNADNYGRTRAGFRILRPLIGDGLFLASGAAWRAQRRTIAPAFVPAAVPAFARATAEALIPAMRDLRRGEAPVDLLGWLQMLALDVAGRALFSFPLEGEIGRDIRTRIAGYGVRFGRPSFLDFALPPWLPSPRDFGRFRFGRRLFASIDRLIAARSRLPADPHRHDLFDTLVAADRTSGGVQSPEAFRDQIATLIVTGHETTAVALFWALYLLAGEPAWQERLAAEATSEDLSPTGVGTAVAVLALSRAAVDEAMRLFPPAYVIVRQAIGADRLGDLPVQPGTVILISPWVLHRHRRLWQQSDAFTPGRFLDTKAASRRFAYLPFGAGPRVCVGASLAVTEATLVVSTLVRSFRIERVDARPVLPVGAITTQPDHVPLFRLIARR